MSHNSKNIDNKERVSYTMQLRVKPVEFAQLYGTRLSLPSLLVPKAQTSDM